MKRILAYCLILINVIAANGASLTDAPVVGSDSVKVYFALNKAALNTSLNDMASVERFIDGIVIAARSGDLDSISVYGYASPDGPLAANLRLSAQRCQSLAKYITLRAAIPLDSIHTYPCGGSWEALRELVINDRRTPERDAVLRVLDESLPLASTDAAASARCNARLKSIDGGDAYRWMAANLFPELRYSLGICAYRKSEGEVARAERIEFDWELISPLQGGYESFATVPPRLNFDPQPAELYHRLALKTNLLYDAMLVPDIEIEWLINPKWSVALEGYLAWWGWYAKTNIKTYRLAVLQPEVKCWFLTRAPWHGMYIGAFVGGGLYDFEGASKGYRGEGAMGGLSIGYMWPVTRCLSLEAAVGAGYLYTRYKVYRPFEGHHVYQRTKDLNYFGPLKVKFSLVWRLWDWNKRDTSLFNQSDARYGK